MNLFDLPEDEEVCEDDAALCAAFDNAEHGKPQLVVHRGRYFHANSEVDRGFALRYRKAWKKL